MADRLRAMFCDHLSLMRGKYLPAAKLKSDGTRMARPTFSVHWDIGKFQGAEPGCGLELDEDPESPDYGKLKVKASDLAGCGLEVDG